MAVGVPEPGDLEGVLGGVPVGGGLGGRVAVLEGQLRRALGELREARQLLAQRNPPGTPPASDGGDEEGEEGCGESRGGGRPGWSSSSSDTEYHEAEEGPPPAPPPRG